MSEASPEQPERAALRAETRRLLEAKIDELPEAFRTVFVLRALEEFTVEEAAVCLGIPQATVRMRYFRAKGLLREALAREIDFSLQDAFAFAGARCDRIVAGVLERVKDLEPREARRSFLEELGPPSDATAPTHSGKPTSAKDNYAVPTDTVKS